MSTFLIDALVFEEVTCDVCNAKLINTKLRLVVTELDDFSLKLLGIECIRCGGNRSLGQEMDPKLSSTHHVWRK